MTKDDKHEGCGISPLATGKDDPFFAACSWHDSAYSHHSWHEQHLRRKEVDRQFYLQMLEIAGGNIFLRARAWIYYRLARTFGARFWEGKRQ